MKRAELVHKNAKREICGNCTPPRGDQYPPFLNVPIQCPFCFAMNRPIAQHCHMCGIDLTEQARNYKEIWKNAVAHNPDFMIDMVTEIKQGMARLSQEK